MRTALANRHIERYLEKCGEEHKFSFGLVIGQPTKEKRDYVVHLARNNDVTENVEISQSVGKVEFNDIKDNDRKDNEENDNDAKDDDAKDSEGKKNDAKDSEGKDNDAKDSEGKDNDVKVADESVETITADNRSSSQTSNLSDIKEQILNNHVLSVTKMIPGCFYVLGVFIIDEENIFENEENIKIVKALIHKINYAFKHHKYLCGNLHNIFRNSEKLLLYYCPSKKEVTVKYYELKEGVASFAHAEWNYLDKPIEWLMFETNYELDDVFPINERNTKINIENHFGITLETISSYIENSEVFVQNEPVDDNLLLENFIKLPHNHLNVINRSYKAILFMPAIASTKDPIVIEKFHGLIRFCGIVASRIWTHQRNTLGDTQIFIKNDILRSLAARIQIYCDGLIDPFTSDAVVVNEPPRRVFYKTPCGAQFSEYIFRGESLAVVKAQAKDILDLDINLNDIIDDLEDAFIDFEEGSTYADDSTTKLANPPPYGKLMYLAGFGTAILILCISIVIHFYMN